MRVDVSAGLRRMNEGRRVMLPRYCTPRHERASQRGRPEGVVGFLFRPASFRPRAPKRFDPFLPPAPPRQPCENSAVDAVLCVRDHDQVP